MGKWEPKNRILGFFPEKTETNVECPYCHQAKVTIPYGLEEPTLCPVCDARFKAEACPDKNPRCRGHIEAEPSPELVKAIEEWKEAHRARMRDQKENPHAWLPCWRDDCRDGVEVARTKVGLIAVGLCDECEGTGKIPRC
jgi:hypothetical protein